MKPMTVKQEDEVARLIDRGEHDSEFVCKNAYKIFKLLKVMFENRIPTLRKLEIERILIDKKIMEHNNDR